MTTTEHTTNLDAATAVVPTPDSPGHFTTEISPEWFAQNGPSGGLLAAIALRAMSATVDDAAARPRSITLHYLRPGTAGTATVEVTTERSGRTVKTLSARILQDGKPLVAALATFAATRPGAADYATDGPDAGAPSDHEPIAEEIARTLPKIGGNYEYRPVYGPPIEWGTPEAIVGGWIELRQDRPLDEIALAVLTDAWIPAPFARLTTLAVTPTLDLTIHFRADASAAPSSATLVRCESRTSAEGFFEEDVEIRSVDGTLLAQARQLALLLPVELPES